MVKIKRVKGESSLGGIWNVAVSYFHSLTINSKWWNFKDYFNITFGSDFMYEILYYKLM